jgi:hypothetical protein
MNSFKYEETMEESEITQKVKELLRYMRTDEYWLERGGNGPYHDEGGELISAYLALKDSKNIPRSETLIIDFNMIQNSNLAKPYIQNRTTTNKVEVVMLSGKSFEIPLENVRSVLDLKSEVVIRVFEHCKRPKSKFHLLQIVNDTTILENYGRAIITDETILTAVICKK